MQTPSNTAAVNLARYAIVALHSFLIGANLAAMLALMATQPWYLWLPINTILLQRWFGGQCPLTLLENRLREKLGMPQIESFKRHYLWGNESHGRVAHSVQERSATANRLARSEPAMSDREDRGNQAEGQGEGTATRTGLTAYTNDASRTLQHGSDVMRATTLTANMSPLSTFAARDTVGTLIIALLLTFATPVAAQSLESQGGLLDGDLREAIKAGREAVSELRQHREALKEQAAESKAWRGIFNREGKIGERIVVRLETFLDRVERWGLVLCGTIAVVAVCGGVAAVARVWRGA